MSELLKIAVTKDDIQKEFDDLRNDIRKSKNEIIKWMFFFCIANIQSTTAILAWATK